MITHNSSIDLVDFIALTGASVLPTSGPNPANGVVRGVVNVSKARYDAWLAEVIESANLRVAAALRDPMTH